MANKKVWVCINNAEIIDNIGESSETILQPPDGTQLDVMEQSEEWYEVATKDGIKGWILHSSVSSNPPSDYEGNSELDDLFDDMEDSAIQSDAADTSRSIR